MDATSCFPARRLGRVVADDGTFVYGGDRLNIVKGTTVQSIPFPHVYAQQPVIDSSAKAVVYLQWNFFTNLHSIHAYSIAQQQDVPLFFQGDNTAPFVSADGTRVMFISTASGAPQVWIVNTDGTGGGR